MLSVMINADTLKTDEEIEEYLTNLNEVLNNE